MSVVFLFPGQGSQYPGMLHDLPDHPRISQTIEEASRILNRDVYSLDTAEALSSTVAVQLALFISSVATAQLLQAEGAEGEMVAGHSVGAFAAAVVAGSIDFRDALLLVQLRGELMERAYPNGYGMGVVIGLQQRELSEIISRVNSPNAPVYLANLNSPCQMTIAGALPAIEEVITAVRSSGARKAKRLNVSVPSHCPLLDSVSNQLATALDKVEMSRPKLLYAGIYSGRVLRDAEAIRQDLVLSVASPVRWYEATALLVEMGARLFIEMQPGYVLTDLASSTFPAIRAISLAQSGIDSAILLAAREKKEKYRILTEDF